MARWRVSRRQPRSRSSASLQDAAKVVGTQRAQNKVHDDSNRDAKPEHFKQARMAAPHGYDVTQPYAGGIATATASATCRVATRRQRDTRATTGPQENVPDVSTARPAPRRYPLPFCSVSKHLF